MFADSAELFTNVKSHSNLSFIAAKHSENAAQSQARALPHNAPRCALSSLAHKRRALSPAEKCKFAYKIPAVALLLRVLKIERRSVA